MNRKPLVSVIVPIYNAELYLEACIGSVLRQTYREWELLLVDDGSTDGSARIARQHADSDPRVKLFSKENGGQSSARNMALDHACGDYIMFLDSDDYYTCDTLMEQCVECISECGQHAVLQFGYVRDDYAPALVSKVYGSKDDIYRDWILDKSVTNYMCDKIYTADIWKELRFQEGMVFEDRYIFPDIISRQQYFERIPVQGYFYRINNVSTTRVKNDRYWIGQFTADEHILQFVSPYPTLYCQVYYRMIHERSCCKVLRGGAVTKICLSVGDICKAQIPQGIKFRLLLIKLVGIKVYDKLLG